MPLPYEQTSMSAQGVFVLGIAVFVVGEVVQMFRSRRRAKLVSANAEVFLRVMVYAAVVMLPVSRNVAPGAVIGGGALVFTLGAVVGWLGLLLRWWSFASLGKYFTVVVRTSEDQPVIDRGPYRVLRHPSYTGLILAFAGAGLMFGNWLGLAGTVLLIVIALVHRLRWEERALTAALGERYRTFAATRARLIPYVW